MRAKVHKIIVDKISAKTLFLAKKVIFLPQCHSTNDMAAELSKNLTVTDGTLVVTDYQTKGKGQRGNFWESNHGENLLFSLIIKCSFLNPSQQFILNQITSLALLATLDNYLENVKVKWPNDIYVGDSKITGILIENSIKSGLLENTIIGIGLNVNQIHFHNPNATSMKLNTGSQYKRETVLEEFLLNFERYYFRLKEKKYNQIKSDYVDRLYRKGESAPFEDSNGFFTGRIVDIDHQGKLVIENGKFKNHYDFKEVKFIID